MNDAILKGLMNKKELNPYSEAYSLEEVSLFIQSLSDNNESFLPRNFGTLIATVYINELHIEIIKDAQNAIDIGGYSLIDAQKFLISSANRATILSMYKTISFFQNIKEKDIIFIEDMLNYKVDNKGNEDEISSIGSQSIEIINQSQRIISRSRFAAHSFTGKGFLFAYYHRLFELGNIEYIVKNLYDAAVWEGGHLKIDEKEGSITLKFSDINLSYIRRIGDMRLQRNIAVSYATLLNNLPLVKEIRAQSYNKKSTRSIKVTDVINGEITTTIDSSNDESFNFYLQYISSMAAFNPFIDIEATKLSNLYDLTLSDVYVILSKIVHCVSTAANIQAIDYANVEPVESNLNKYALRIKEDILVDQLELSTNFDREKIGNFVSSLLFDPLLSDYWRTPIFKEGDFLVFVIEPIVYQNKLYLTDFLLQKGGISMTERGIMMENYIKKELRDILIEKRYFHVIPEQKKFRLKDGKYEEIDLIINIKHTLIIAEVKCISSIVDSRSTFNAYKQLLRGVEQLKRKAKFLDDNTDKFTVQIGDVQNKDTLLIVLTNLPNFTGLIVDDVLIIDSIAMINYFSKGSLENNKEQTHFSYYSNEDEFSHNMRNHMHNLPVVWSLKKYFKFYIKQVTPDGYSPKYFAEVVESDGEVIG